MVFGITTKKLKHLHKFFEIERMSIAIRQVFIKATFHLTISMRG